MRGPQRFSASALLLIGALWFPASGASSSSAPSLRLFDLTTAHGIVNERPFQPAQVFAPDDEVIYLWYAAEGCAIGTTIRSTWLYLDTDPPSRLSEGAVTVERDGDWGQFNFTLAPGRRWASGRYRIELRVNDEVMADAEFVVSARPTMLASASERLPDGHDTALTTTGFSPR